MNNINILLESLVPTGEVLKDACIKMYFGKIVVAFTTENSIKYYSSYPWNFAIYGDTGWRQFYGMPNRVETSRKALRRAWYRAKWLTDGTWNNHYK